MRDPETSLEENGAFSKVYKGTKDFPSLKSVRSKELSNFPDRFDIPVVRKDFLSS